MTNEDRLTEICRDHQGLMMRVAQAFAPEAADRAELFQDILVAIWQALPQFNAQARLSTYVYRVALNCALNWKRSRRRYREKLDQYESLWADFTEEISPATRDRLNWLHARIQELPPLDRSMILLALERVGYDEIAAVTGLSETHVGVRLHRIKQQLAAKSEDFKNEL